MNLLCCINDGYLYPALTMLYSIREHNSDKINLYVLSTKFSKKSEKILLEKCSKVNINVNLIRYDFKKNFETKDINYTIDMYLRIFAFDLLPKEVEKVLYLDADMLILKDLANLYNIEISNKVLACVRDINFDKPFLLEHISKLNIKHDYFNSGMLLLNLKKQREVWSSEKIENLILEKGELLKYPDQDILNCLCKEDELIFLDDIFNNQKKDYDNKTVVLHYIGALKPWNHFKLKDYEKLFWKTFKKVKNFTFRMSYLKNSTKHSLKSLKHSVIKNIKRIFKREKKA